MNRETNNRFMFHVGQNDVRPVQTAAFVDFTANGMMPIPRQAKTEVAEVLKIEAQEYQPPILSELGE